MSKFAKAIIILSCLLFFGGLLLSLTSLALGANPTIIGERLNSMGLSNIYFWGHNRIYNSAETLPAPEKPESPDKGEYDIKHLNLDFEVGDITISQGSDFELIFGGANSQKYFYQSRDNDTWTIGSRKHWNIFDFWWDSGKQLKLTIVLPADFVAESADIDLGAGNMRAGALYAKNIYVDVGVGNCQISELLAQSAALNVGLGNMEIYSFHADQSYLDVGMGAMALNTSHSLENYFCKLSVGLGTVTLGKNNYNGVADIKSGSEDAPYQMDVNCGMGSITVRENPLATTI